ncbi:hypothetical protein DE146DRAFT_769918 [Phaeosphaeria sp. MPI-PUGE-AT-0046c]|nr:hypothetical protein DE146DRAFT_769918 [Phaeosphaeria sp. MPI-PUGE-AT-0046c]
MTIRSTRIKSQHESSSKIFLQTTFIIINNRSDSQTYQNQRQPYPSAPIQGSPHRQKRQVAYSQALLDVAMAFEDIETLRGKISQEEVGDEKNYATGADEPIAETNAHVNSDQAHNVRAEAFQRSKRVAVPHDPNLSAGGSAHKFIKVGQFERHICETVQEERNKADEPLRARFAIAYEEGKAEISDEVYDKSTAMGSASVLEEILAHVGIKHAGRSYSQYDQIPPTRPNTIACIRARDHRPTFGSTTGPNRGSSQASATLLTFHSGDFGLCAAQDPALK